jgi:DNA polymerase I-like protein with 3'-5' exonuclease and polymerase domains
MDVITLDMETFYSQEYSLSKMTTEEYIRDPRFQVVGVSTKVNDEPAVWVTGPKRDILAHLNSLPFETSMLLAQNTMFDGAILTWLCGIKPRALADTMLMSRAISGTEVGHSLAALSERYGKGKKGFEVLAAKGKRRQDFTPAEMRAYGQYCINDSELTYAIFKEMMARGFPKKELQLIDITLRMFTDPILELDGAHLREHLKVTQLAKRDLIATIGGSPDEPLDSEANKAAKSHLMSNPKFALLLEELGVTPPRKISPTTGKETYAFAKGDEDFKALLDHEDVTVQALVAARMGVKSTLEETRTQRFIGIASRGALPVPIRYYAAHTGRWGGSDKINLQNLPSRGKNAKQIKKSIVAPTGYTLIDADSAQIEARVLAWLAGQDDVVTAFRNKEDVYILMASRIYNKDPADVTYEERAVGKTVVLGAGYGVGHQKLQLFLKMQAGVEVTTDEAQRIIDIYRSANHKIKALWRAAGDMLAYLQRGDACNFGKAGVLEVDTDEQGIRLPSGLYLRYPDLRAEKGDTGYEYSYKVRNGWKYVYGGAVVENVCQAIARCIIGEQMILINKRYRPVLTVHDSVVCCVPDEVVDEARAYIEECMSVTPDWAAGLPVACESDVGKRYGE